MLPKNSLFHPRNFMRFTFIVMLGAAALVGCGDDEDGEPRDDNSGDPNCEESNLALAVTPGDFSLTADASGGITPYQYSINGTDFQDTPLFENLTIEEVTVTVRDSLGCTATQTATPVDGCPRAGLELTATFELFAIQATASGGRTPYRFSIDGTSFQDSPGFEGLADQDYTLTVQDAFGCEASLDVPADSIATFLDTRDSNRYRATLIGNQIWMAENLNFRGGDLVEDTDVFCYNFVADSCNSLGAMYPWEVAQTVTIDGWRLPSREDWESLVNELGGFEVAGPKLGVGGESGFNEILAGGMSRFDASVGHGQSTLYWSSTEDPADTTDAFPFFVRLENDMLVAEQTIVGLNKRSRYYVRLLKNNN